jgi:hypothetical protein
MSLSLNIVKDKIIASKKYLSIGKGTAHKLFFAKREGRGFALGLQKGIRGRL